MPAGLACPACGRTYDDRWRCTCGAPLDFADPPRPDGPAPARSDLDFARGLWAFESFLPVVPHATLGEGWTPLVDAPAWDAAFKLEYVTPTASFKDRGATTVVSRAVEVGAETVVEDSSGNAGAAVATYAARAGLDADVYVPASAKASKLRAIEAAGATPVRIEGDRAAVTDACLDAVEAGEGWYASHAWNPAFFAGTATFAYEVAAARDWSVPDAVVTPLGHGTLFLGAYRGFRALVEAGWTDSMPRLLGVQAAGYDPVAADRHGESEGENDAADGIQIRSPVRRAEIDRAIEATDGDAISLSGEAVRETHAELGRHGFDVEPTAATGPAGLLAYRDRGVLDADADVVVPLTGSGLKT
ncbi:MAG: pyridoxal-phosphate dependent enzyme [Haloplanus sp.]